MKTTLSRRLLLTGAAALGAGGLDRPARAELPKLRTVEEGYITIAMSGTMPTTGVRGDQVAGSDPIIIQAIAEKLGLKAKPAIMAWAATIQAIRSGRADVMCGYMGWTKARADVLLLTDPIYYGANFLTTQKDRPTSDRMNVTDLKGAVVGVITGTNYALDIKKIPGVKELKLYDNQDSCVRDLLAGRIDYASLDSMAIDYFMLQQPNAPIKQVPVIADPQYPYLTNRSGAVLGMSQDNPDLFDAVNAGIQWIWATKKNAEILAQNGMTSPNYLVPAPNAQRIGVDRDASGNILGPAAHTPKDFSMFFS